MRVDRRACLGNGAPSENAKQATASKAVQCNRWSDFMIQFFRPGAARAESNNYLAGFVLAGTLGRTVVLIPDCRRYIGSSLHSLYVSLSQELFFGALPNCTDS